MNKPILQFPLNQPPTWLANNPLVGHAEYQVPPLPPHIRAVLAKPVSFYREMAQPNPLQPAQEPLTNIAFLLDASGSMQWGRAETVAGFNQQVLAVRQGAEGVGRTTFTEIHFNDEVTIRRVAAELSTLQPLSDETYKPSGGTALFDALGDAISALLQTERMDSPTTATLVTLFTDGGERDSKRYSADVLSQLVQRLEATGRWTFALVGPAAGVSHIADLLSIHKGNVKGYDPVDLVSRERVFHDMAGASSTYLSARAMGSTQLNNLYAAPGHLR